MSRIGKKPVNLPKNLNVSYDSKNLVIKGPKGEMHFTIPSPIDLIISETELSVKADYKNDTNSKALMGTTRATIENIVFGVTEGFKKKLNLVGVGYRAAVNGDKLQLNLGYSHPVNFKLPHNVHAKVEGNTQIFLESCDKQLLGQVIADIRNFRPPEPYKGKGILLEGEVVRRKAGKSGKK